MQKIYEISLFKRKKSKTTKESDSSQNKKQKMIKYDLELNRVIEKIEKSKAKLVCIQLPDGLKPEAKTIQNEIESKTKAKVIIWLGSCYGACDVPNTEDFDLIVQFGHSEWEF